MAKYLLAVAVLVSFSFSQAQTVSTKFCVESVERAMSGSPELSVDERLNSIVDGINEGLLMSLTEDQKAKAKTKFEDVLKINPNKINDFESVASMPCYMEMTTEERVEAGNNLKSQMGL